MSLAFTEEQKQIKETAQRFFTENAPVEALRQLRDRKDATGYSSELWQQMAELGFAGINVPEEYDGLGMSFKDLGAICEEAGHTLAVSPLFATSVLCASLLANAGSEEQKKQYLPAIAAGECSAALALDEGNHHNPDSISCAAEKTAAGYQLNGDKVFVLDGHSADILIVVAQCEGQPAYFLIPADTEGVTITRTQMLDNRNAARINLSNVSVDESALLPGSSSDALQETLDKGRICLAAEMLGGAQEAFNRTVEYLKEREQFGVKIATFQALRHRAAIIFSELELTRSCVMAALDGLDSGATGAELAALASLAKASANDCYELSCKEAVQMHGGIGVTDELEIGFFLKRSRVAIHTLGDSAFHRDRYADLQGF
jgi:alkylation response protein AidB-like acyl-CoA dehydrogenase